MHHGESDPLLPVDAPMQPDRLSIVIPALNEAERIAATVQAVFEFAARVNRSIELILVDDGSTDGTLDLALDRQLKHSGKHILKWFRHPFNRGKGAAIRTGLAAASGDPILLCDADLSTPLDQLDRLEPALADGCDVVIASRDLPDSRLDPPQPLHRRLLAWTLRSLRRSILLPEICDTQCGFKLITRRAVNAILPHLTLDGWLYDCELLALARQRGFRIREVAVTWRDRRDSRVRPLRDLIPTLRELLILRRRFRARQK
jgi:dolichyl-phosphate beta-glucosyltransferase